MSTADVGTMQTESATLSPSVPVDLALDTWYQQHRQYIAGETPRTYAEYVKVLKRFFQQLPLGQIDIGNIRAYQTWRKERCGATRINSELSALQMTMKQCEMRAAGRWTNLWDDRIASLYKTVPVPKIKVRQNMSEEEERRLLAVAFKDPRRRVAGHCLVLMANTSMGFGELRHVKRKDVFLNDDPLQSVSSFVAVNEGSKNDYRIRTIPLNSVALRSMRWILKRWQELGGTEPEQYILPHNARRSEKEQARPGHKRKTPIFDEPMGHIYRAARGIFKEAGLSQLDIYDMRSHAITKLLSNPDVSEQMYTEIVGHVGNAMKRRYSKQRMENKQVAMDAMCKNQVEFEEQLITLANRLAQPSVATAQPRPRTEPIRIAQPPEKRDCAKERVTQTPRQTQLPSVTLAPQRQSDSSLRFATGFYVTSSTW